jgi:hypothetical protein
MIEFFLVANYVTNISKNKKKENKNIENLFNNNESVTESLTKKSVNIDALNFVLGIFSLIISIFSAKLAYECNSKANDASQIISVLFGFFFSGFYLVYYFIWHSILGNKC